VKVVLYHLLIKSSNLKVQTKNTTKTCIKNRKNINIISFLDKK